MKKPREGLEHCIILYFDIFAYSEKILEVFKLDSREIDAYASQLQATWEEVDAIIKKINGAVLYYFSDSCFIIYPLEQINKRQKEEVLFNCIQSAETIYSKFISKELLIRGAISCGEIYYSRNILLGPAIIRAVRSEEKCSAPILIIKENEIEGIIDRRNFISPLGAIKTITNKDNSGKLSVYPILPLDYNKYINLICGYKEKSRTAGNELLFKYWLRVIEILEEIRSQNR